jgi:putative endonuclease
MTNKKQAIGAWGEAAAATYLSDRGYEILGRNVRTPHGEIDLVARLGEVIIFVEVRTLTSSRFAHPEESITRRKQSHMLATAEDYIQLHVVDHWQFNAIAVEGRPGEQPVINHFENVIG